MVIHSWQTVVHCCFWLRAHEAWPHGVIVPQGLSTIHKHTHSQRIRSNQAAASSALLSLQAQPSTARLEPTVVAAARFERHSTYAPVHQNDLDRHCK
jgi:hypothetical protein